MHTTSKCETRVAKIVDKFLVPHRVDFKNVDGSVSVPS
jgi:hypothetical protein